MRIWAFCVGLPFGLPRSFGWQQLEHGRLSRLKVMTQNRFRFAALDLSLPFKLFFLQLRTSNDGKTRAWSRLSVYKTDNNLQIETFDVAQCPSFIFLLASYGLKRAGISFFPTRAFLWPSGVLPTHLFPLFLSNALQRSWCYSSFKLCPCLSTNRVLLTPKPTTKLSSRQRNHEARKNWKYAIG